MKRYFVLIAAVVALLALAWNTRPAAAQMPYVGSAEPRVSCESPALTGVVLDEQGQPIVGVTVSAWFTADGEVAPVEYRAVSGTAPSFGPSGWLLQGNTPHPPYYGYVPPPRTGTMRVAVGAFRHYESTPVEVTIHASCNDPSRPNRWHITFRRGASTPLPTPPAGGSGQEAPPIQPGARCRAFSEAASGQGAFRVCDDGNGRFLSTFEQYGLQAIGYPISQRYRKDGFVVQAFQKAILQWNNGQVAFVNSFDELHTAGFDDRLLTVRQTPNQLPAGWDGEGLTFEQIVQRRQALLNERPALRSAYFGAREPLLFFGLPTSEVEDMGNHYAIRLQRAVLQEWKEDVPWARAGQVTIANGGDIAKELGHIPAFALVPTP